MSQTDTASGGGQGLPPADTPPKAEAPSHRGARLRRRARSLGGLVLSLALTLLGLLLITFIIGRVMPIDPVLKVVGERATQAQYDAAYQAMGLDKPIWQQFLRYVSEVLQGDFGRSISTGHPVSEDLKRVFPATVELATLGTLIGVCVGVPLGVIAAARRLGRPDRPRAGAGRLFDADLLAGADGAFAVLRHPWLDRRPGTAGHHL